MNRFTIFLSDVRFDVCVGILPQEQEVTQPLSVSLEVRLPSSPFESTLPTEENSSKPSSASEYLQENLAASISYADLYEILTEEMRAGGGLLETIAVRLARRIQNHYPAVEDGVIEIRKLNPPIPGICGEAGVKYFFEKSH